MKYKLIATCIYEYGQRRDSYGNPHQEDYTFPSKDHLTDDARLFILCDGMGGHDAGEVASKAVCDAMSQSILNDGHDPEGVFTAADFENAIDAAFKELDSKDTGAEKKMGTTLAFLKLFDRGAFIAHMGDSRVYHIRPGETGEQTQILHVTPDHSLINDLLKAEAITKEEARTSKQKNVITRAMQPGMERRPKAEVYQTSDIKPGDYFYICSDGMLEDPDMEEGKLIRNIFSEKNGDIARKTQILTSVTGENRDNHSAFLIQITEVIDPVVETEKEISLAPTATVGFTAELEDGPAEAETANVAPSATTTPAPASSSPKQDLSTPSASPMPAPANVPTEKLNKKLKNLKAIIMGSIGVMAVLIFGIGYMIFFKTDKEEIHTAPVSTPQKTYEQRMEELDQRRVKPNSTDRTNVNPEERAAQAPANQTKEPKADPAKQDTPKPQPQAQSPEQKPQPTTTPASPTKANADKAKDALTNLKNEASNEGVVESDQNLQKDSTKLK